MSCKEFMYHVYVCRGWMHTHCFRFYEDFMSTLQIDKKEVDNFEKGKRIPSCQLIAECEADQPTTLKHSVTLSGAKDPHNSFTIYRPCDSGEH